MYLLLAFSKDASSVKYREHIFSRQPFCHVANKFRGIIREEILGFLIKLDEEGLSVQQEG